MTFQKITEDTSSRDRYGNPQQNITSIDVPGCLFRPFNFKESNGVGTQTVLQRWKLTAPPAPAVLAATATDAVVVNGVNYQIAGGVEIFYDFNGPYKCTLYCDLQLY